MYNNLIKTVFAILFVLSVFHVNSYAGKTQPGDFAFGIPVEADDSASFFRFSVPKEVYENVTSGDLNDIRMFNGNDELVPFTLKSGRSSEIKVDKKERDIRLPLFPIPANKGTIRSDLSLLIKKDRSGSLIKIEEKNSKAVDGKRVTSYILDLSKIKRRPEYLSFGWNEDKDFTMDIRVQSGSNLSDFSTIVHKASLVDIKYGNSRLHKNRVYLPSFNGRYLRILIERNSSDTLITDVSAHLGETSLFKRVKGRIVKPSIVRSETKSNDYIIKLSGFFPVKRIKILLPQKNSIVKYKLFSGSSMDELTEVSKGTLFKLIVEGSVFTSDDIFPGYAKSDKFWVLRIDDSEGGIGDGLPVIDMEYFPHDLIFTARGNGPFKLLFGSYLSEPFNNSTGLMIEQLSSMKKRDMIKEVKTGLLFESGGMEKLLPPPSPVSYKKYILWAILFSGVILTAYMAYRLISQMNKEDNQ